MPLLFSCARSDTRDISVRGITNMGRDSYEQAQLRFHDGGLPTEEQLRLGS